ncbi:unnamed protein product [Danaus chrysippus]|uniref:(African queen) hypothetical protein n=1 Tax=Danaus chrysippus TaxID=151541 RepID=A0A8J2QI37_9NEOP|nr:unnamed protein product [Danaus chrysippus]
MFWRKHVVAAADSVECLRCSCQFHRVYVVYLSPDDRIPKWICKGCKPKPCSPAIFTDLASLQGANNTEHSSLLSAVEDPGVVSSLLEHIKLRRVELVNLTREVSSFRQELASLKGTLSEVCKRVDNVEARPSQLENKTPSVPESHLLEDIANLKTELKEQSCLLNDIEISGITKRNGENLQYVVGLIVRKISVTLEERDIVFIDIFIDTSERSRSRPST